MSDREGLLGSLKGFPGEGNKTRRFARWNSKGEDWESLSIRKSWGGTAACCLRYDGVVDICVAVCVHTHVFECATHYKC